jgi:hypothetical protein
VNGFKLYKKFGFFVAGIPKRNKSGLRRRTACVKTSSGKFGLHKEGASAAGENALL